MRKRLIYAIGAVALGNILIWGLYFYNNYQLLKDKEKAVEDSWEIISTQYQERLNISIDLDALTKKSKQSKAENDEIERLKAIWEKARETNNIVGMKLATEKIDKRIESIIALINKNPTLKSSEDYLRLQERLQNTEQVISVEQEKYNNAVTVYNRQIKVFPAGEIAGVFRLSSYPYYKS